MPGNNKSAATSLEVIQEWCEWLLNIFSAIRTQAGQLQTDMEQVGHQDGQLPAIKNKVSKLLEDLVLEAFIVAEQPHQILKTNSTFSVTVRLLLGRQLQMHIGSPRVSAMIVTESQATQLLDARGRGAFEEFKSGNLLNHSANMEFKAADGHVTGSAFFRNLQLKSIKRADRSGPGSVMEEKFRLFFWTDFRVGEQPFSVWAFSCPVVVIVHGGHQKWLALATIIWNNTVADNHGPPFDTASEVPWSDLAKSLNETWQDECKSPDNVGRALSKENLDYLATKIFGDAQLSPGGLQIRLVSWTQFMRNPMPGSTFKFWEWFHSALTLTRDDLRQSWNAGHILGFVSKQKGEQFLSTGENGCFLLRFSDSVLGAVSISYMGLDQQQTRSIFHLEPYTSPDLARRSLADTITDLDDHLTVLYPNVSKEAFRACANQFIPPRQVRAGYVPTPLRRRLEGDIFKSKLKSLRLKIEISGAPGPQNDLVLPELDINFDLVMELQNMSVPQ